MIKQTTINQKNKNRKNPENSPTNHPRYSIFISIMNKPEWQASEPMFHWLEEKFHRGYIKSLYIKKKSGRHQKSFLDCPAMGSALLQVIL